MSEFKYLFRSDRDFDGTPNCGEMDSLLINEYNDGLLRAKEFYTAQLKQKDAVIELYEKCRAYYLETDNNGKAVTTRLLIEGLKSKQDKA